MRLSDPSWFFNRLMLWGAGLGFIIGLFAVEIRDTIHHKGPGLLEVSEERSEEVNEGQYKHVHYVRSGFFLALGLLGWFYVAKYSRDDTAKAEAKEKYLEAQIRRNDVYHRAFTSAIDGSTESAAHAEALLSDVVREASEDLELACRRYCVASIAAKREEN